MASAKTCKYCNQIIDPIEGLGAASTVELGGCPVCGTRGPAESMDEAVSRMCAEIDAYHAARITDEEVFNLSF